jgi:hypothetical protein
LAHTQEIAGATPAAAKLAELRARIPDGFRCVDDCVGCCGPVLHSALEQARIDAIGGVKQAGPGICDCHYLRGKACGIYAERPLMCRLYGNTPLLPCPYGGQSSHMLTIGETLEILDEYDSLSGETVECTAGTFVWVGDEERNNAS